MNPPKATRPHPLSNQIGRPAKAAPCPGHGHEQFGDERDGTCLECGRQVGGKEMPSTRSPKALGDHSTPARKVYRGGYGSGLAA